MSLGLVPPSEILYYINGWLSHLNMDEEEMNDLLISIERLDDQYFSHHSKKTKHERPNAIVGPQGQALPG